MKKKVFFLFLGLMLLSYASFSQFKFGFQLGSPFKLKTLNSKSADNITFLRPFSVGLTSESMILPFGFGFDVSVLYELERISSSDIKKPVTINYFNIPVNLKWKIGGENLKFYAMGGVSFLLNLYHTDDISFVANKDTYKPEDFNWGLSLGMGIEFLKNFQIGLSYYNYLQLSYKQIQKDILFVDNDNSSSLETNNNRFIIYISYLF